jgi:soluble lytic murein transglycosylase-like protein
MMIECIMRYIAVIITVLTLAAVAHADVYVYTDRNGTVLLTDKPYLENEGYARGRAWFSSPLLEYQSIIKHVSGAYRVDPTLVTAIISTESNFDELAISKTGAMGLMQLMPGTATQLGVEDPFDPKDNIEGGVKYLRYLIERFDGKIEHAVAAFNCGPSAVEKYGGIPPYGETRRYVKKVFDRYHGKKSMKLNPSYRRSVQKIVRNDGSILYTNTSPEAYLKRQ